MWKKLKYFFYFYPDGSDFTRTNYYDEQMTTTVYSATAQKEQTQTGRRRWIWSGESDNSEEPNYGNWADDHDDDTDTSYEIAYSMWYDTHAHREWHDVDGDDYYVDDNDYVDDTVQQPQAHTRVPFMNLTKEQRDAKSAEFKFGLCSNCDAGLDDKSEFVCEPRGGPTGSFVITCNACYAYHQHVAFNRLDYGSNGGCN
jgi:hypothetical protein